MSADTRDVTIPVDEQAQYAVRPANGTADQIVAQGFVGARVSVLPSGDWVVRLHGEAPDLTEAVFRCR